MRKLISLLMMMSFVISAFAQKDVTTFLGIPVDGFKPDMRKQLITKGFTPRIVDGEEIFEGEFNGNDVEVNIVTNNNKVCRIMLLDKNGLDDVDIKNRFNTLVRQFENNARYIIPQSYTIPENEKILHEMVVNKKTYEANYYQRPISGEDISSIDVDIILKKPVWFKIVNHLGRYYIVMYYDNEYNRANGEDL